MDGEVWKEKNQFQTTLQFEQTTSPNIRKTKIGSRGGYATDENEGAKN